MRPRQLIAARRQQWTLTIGVCGYLSACTAGEGNGLYPCVDEQRDVAWSNALPLGFSALDVLNTFPQHLHVPLTWATDDGVAVPAGWLSDLHLTVEGDATRSPIVELPPRGTPDSYQYPCNKALVVPIRLSITTSDGGIVGSSTPNELGHLRASSLDFSGLSLRLQLSSNQLTTFDFSSSGFPEPTPELELELVGSPELVTLTLSGPDDNYPRTFATGIPEP